ncbi:uncharacterized protein LOC144990527 [Oryzias latipes]
MALTQVINTKQSGPYAAPPPLHICVLREREKSQVITWDFSGNTAAPLSCREPIPPYYILPTKNTAFYRTSPVPVTESLEQEADRLLNPPSVVTPLTAVDQVRGQPLLTFEGKVLEVFAIRKIRSGRNDVPMRQLRLQQDGAEVNVSLWREAALIKLEAGGHVRLTHIKRGGSVGGFFQSTNFTTMEVVIQAAEEVQLKIIAIREGREKGDLELLLDDFETLDVGEELWNSLEHSFEDGPLTIQAEKTGNRVSKITVIN